MRDFELPNGLQDADIEMAELTATANREAALRKRGICAHSWRQGPPGPWNAPRSDWKCLDCGRTFKTAEEMDDERREALD